MQSALCSKAMCAAKVPSMSACKFIDLPDVRLRVAMEGSGPLVVMVHGFPESWFSWRHQMTPIAQAGFTACAIDVRGYGGSDRPRQVADYAMERMVADITGVIELLSPRERAIILGHDWGAPMVWNTALIRPDRVRAVGALSVPHLGLSLWPFSVFFFVFFSLCGLFFFLAWF